MPPREGDAELALGLALTLEVRAVGDAYALVRHALGVEDQDQGADVADDARTARALARLVAVLNAQLDEPRRMAINGGNFGEAAIEAALRLVYSGARDRLLMAREMKPELLHAAVIALGYWAAACAAAVFGELAGEMFHALPTYPDVADVIGTVCSREIQDEVRRFFG